MGEPSTSTTFQSMLSVRDGHYIMPLGELRVEQVLNRGHLSESYLAYHEGLDLRVELRVIKPEVFAQIGPFVDEELTKACRKYARIRHPNITALYDMGRCHGRRYITSEYLTGVPLNERIKERPLSEAEALKLMTPIAEGLGELWKNDYIHRGVSPLRVLINSDGIPKLDIVILPRVPLEPVLIEAHAAYMAGYWPPEELRQSNNIDSRSDMFSFGASLYYALTGSSPFGKGSRTELIARTMTEPAKDPRELNAQLNADVCQFVMRCLKSNPAERFESTCEFMEALYSLRSQMCCAPTRSPSTFGPLVQVPETQRRMSFNAGDVVGQCELERVVGSGAFGVVFKARHKLLDIPVAIKFLPAELAQKDSQYINLFLREARTAIRIRHKHVIGLYEAGQQDGQYYLMMEFAPNGSLHDRLQQTSGRLPVAETIRILKETALGLAAAEESNIVHRDIKPANLMFGAQNEIKIADLGLAKRVARPDKVSGDVAASIQAEQLTLLRGEVSLQGTPDFMAPEMATSPDKVDIRADLYALGVTGYRLLAGRLPFEGETPIQAIMKHVTQPVPPLREFSPGVPPKLEQLVMRLLDKKPENRYQRPGELAAALAGM